MLSKREAAFHELEKLVGVHESEVQNRGPMVDKIEAADTLPGNGYSYCQSTQNFAWKQANDELLAGGTASVWAFTVWGDKLGYRVTRPAKYDHVTYDFGESGGPFDHVGQIARVVKFGPVIVIQTIEGNTSPTTAGSQSNGGGIYRKTRTVRASTVRFYRVPGSCPHQPPTPAQRRSAARTWVLAERAHGATWTALKSTKQWKLWKSLGGK